MSRIKSNYTKFLSLNLRHSEIRAICDDVLSQSQFLLKNQAEQMSVFLVCLRACRAAARESTLVDLHGLRQGFIPPVPGQASATARL